MTTKTQLDQALSAIEAMGVTPDQLYAAYILSSFAHDVAKEGGTLDEYVEGYQDAPEYNIASESTWAQIELLAPLYAGTAEAV